MKTNKLHDLAAQYGIDKTIQQIINAKNRPYKCPKCDGNGYTEEEYNAYPKGLPDSLITQDWQIRKVPCNLCDEEGWTRKEMIAKTKITTEIIGYEEK